MDELQILEDLTDTIVSAGSDPNRWGRVVDLFADRIPGAFAGLIGLDHQGRHPVGVHSAGLEASLLDSFAAYYGSINPWTPFWNRAPVFEALAANLTLPAKKFSNTEFYHDWLLPTRRLSAVGIKLAETETKSVRLYVHYLDDQVRTHEPHLLRIINAARPAFRAAIEANGLLTPRGLAREKGGHPFLEACGLPCLVVDGNGVLVAANRLAEEMLAADVGVGVRRGRLEVRGDPEQTSALLETIRRAANPLGQAGQRMLVRGPTGKPHGFVAASPFHDEEIARATSWFFGSTRHVLVALRGFAWRPARIHALVVEYLGLTEREADIALDLVAGSTVEEISRDRSISILTARKHVNNIFSKTGCRRQADLVAMVAMFY